MKGIEFSKTKGRVGTLGRHEGLLTDKSEGDGTACKVKVTVSVQITSITTINQTSSWDGLSAPATFWTQTSLQPNTYICVWVYVCIWVCLGRDLCGRVFLYTWGSLRLYLCDYLLDYRFMLMKWRFYVHCSLSLRLFYCTVYWTSLCLSQSLLLYLGNFPQFYYYRSISWSDSCLA